MEARLLPSDGWPFVYGRRMDQPGSPTVLLYGHYDVQPPDPLEAWISPPFEPEIRNGRIYGRGVGDNKGQHLAQLLAIESWLAVGDRLPCNLVVLLEGEEELGSPHIADCVRAHRELLAKTGMRRLDEPQARPFFDRLSVWPTLTVYGFHSGYGGPGSKTVLPCEAFANAWGEEPLLIPPMGGSLPDYVWTKILGVDSFIIPYANHDEANHAPNENLEVERFFNGIRTGAALLASLGLQQKS